MNQFMINYLEKIVNIPSPSGFTGRLMEVLGDDARDMGYEVAYTSRGALMIRVPGPHRGQALSGRPTAIPWARCALHQSRRYAADCARSGYTMESVRGNTAPSTPETAEPIREPR